MPNLIYCFKDEKILFIFEMTRICVRISLNKLYNIYYRKTTFKQYNMYLLLE